MVFNNNEKNVIKKILGNGLTLLIKPVRHIPKISIQLWYNVGSKDEKTGQKGIAHLIEHMIFKGTEKLSESDINMITYKLSGSCNAFTSYDYTGYLFDFPTHHWEEALSIMADCMTNCTFRQEFLNSEMKAVIQELKMYRDNYSSTLIERMISTIFADHPYHYPIIGFKQDLWSVNRQTLLDFYKKHYVPNNATLVIVGDVDPDDATAKTEHYFGHLKPNYEYKKETFYHGIDLINTSVKLYRDVQQSLVMLGYVIPGAYQKMNYIFEIISWILGAGKGSRLYRILVDELQLVNELETFTYELFDHGIFFIYFQPKDEADVQHIITIINKEIDNLVCNGATWEELNRAVKKTNVEHLSILETTQKQAYFIGHSYLATQDENFINNYLHYDTKNLPELIKSALQNHFKPSLMHQGIVMPLQEKDLSYWHVVQNVSDEEDKKILSKITRDVPVQEGVSVHKIEIKKPKAFHFPQAKKVQLKNGLTLLYHNNPTLPSLEIVLSLKAKHYYDPYEKQGLISFVTDLLQEGTKKRSGTQLAQLLESNGMQLDTTAGYITLTTLKEDLALGIEILHEILTEPAFSDEEIEKLRAQYIANLNDYWDNPSQFVSQIAREEVYKNHPYSKNSMGSIKSIQSITRQDILNAYREFITPAQATLAIVGDIGAYDITSLFESKLGAWNGPHVEQLNFTQLAELSSKTILKPMNRDQIVLCFTGLSIARNDEDFDKLLIFDQIFTGGALGSMSSKLFLLREQSGLFYTIGGSLLKHSDEQPGMIFIRTIVSCDRIEEAEKAILATIEHATETLTQDDLNQAKNALLNCLTDNFESNKSMAYTFLMVDRFKLAHDYFDTRAKKLQEITLEQIKQATKRVLKSNNLTRIKIGRI